MNMNNIDVNVKAVTTPPDVTAQYKTIILKKHLVNGVNTLTQAMISQSNVKYVVKYDYVLSSDITVPANCVLEFDGGSINGEHTITGTNTGIGAGLVKIFNTDVNFAGKWNFAEVYPEWFGAIGDGVTDDTLALQKAIGINRNIQGNRGYVVKFGKASTYLIRDSLYVYPFTSIIGANTDQKWLGMTTIRQTSNFSIFILCKETTTATDIVIKGIQLYGNGLDDEGCCGVVDSNDVEYVYRCRFENVRLRNLRYGIKISSACCSCTFNNIYTNQGDYVCFGIYIGATRTEEGSLLGHFWGCLFVECSLANCRVGAVYIKHSKCMTTPSVFRHCAFENCGWNYNINEHHIYGTFGIYYEFIGKGGSNLTFEDCYFENNSPNTQVGQITPNDYGYVESVLPNGSGKYITNPNELKTGELVVKTVPENIINVIRCHFSTAYQVFVIENGGNFNCSDCTFQVLAITNTSVPPLTWLGKSVIKLKIDDSKKYSIKFHCPIGSLVEHPQHEYAYYFFKNVTRIMSFIGTEEMAFANIDIYCPILGNYTQWHSVPWITHSNQKLSNQSDSVAEVYVDQSAVTNGIGTKDFPIKDLGLFLYTIAVRVRYNTIRFILLNDLTVSAHPSGNGCVFPSNCNYEFIGINPDIAITLDTDMLFLQSNCTFKGIKFNWMLSKKIVITNGNVNLLSCKFNATEISRLFSTTGTCGVSVVKPTITLGSGISSCNLVKRDSGQLHVDIFGANSETLSKITYDGADDGVWVPSGNSRPTLKASDAGFQFFDTSGGAYKPIWWTGTAWVDATGTSV